MDKYTDPSIPGSFSSISKFKQNNKKTSTDDITFSDAYTVHKVPHTHFKRVKTFAPNVNSQWQVDLVDITNKNLSHKWLLAVVDVFSRYAFIEPVHTKAAARVADAFESIFKRSRYTPQMIYSDEGKEFLGKCTKMFKDNNIYYKTDRSDMKAAIVERFIRTIRLKIERYITWAKSNNFLPILQKLVESYNNTIHPIHGRTPTSVYNLSKAAQKSIYREFEEIKFEDLEKNEFDEQVIKFTFKIGDHVKIVIPKDIFTKATGMKRWSDTYYQISELCPTIPPTYKVKDLEGKANDWRYYKEDLQKVNPPEPVKTVVKPIQQKLSQNAEPEEPRALRERLARAVKK
jgi:hypothetical protein